MYIQVHWWRSSCAYSTCLARNRRVLPQRYSRKRCRLKLGPDAHLSLCACNRTVRLCPRATWQLGHNRVHAGRQSPSAPAFVCDRSIRNRISHRLVRGRPEPDMGTASSTAPPRCIRNCLSSRDTRGWSADDTSDPHAGIFGPSSISWKVNRESVLFLGAGRAALLQLAHPWVAAALHQHSNLGTDPIARFHNTFRVVFTMVFWKPRTGIGPFPPLVSTARASQGSTP